MSSVAPPVCFLPSVPPWTHKESWAERNWCFQTVGLEKTFMNLLDSKEIKPVNPKGNQPWIFIGRTGAKAEALILSPPDGKSWLIVKDPDAGKDWGEKEKGSTEDEMVGWHHWLNGQTQWSLSKVPEMVEDREAWHSSVHGVSKSRTWLSGQSQTDSSIHHVNPFLVLIFPEWRRTPLQGTSWKSIMSSAHTPVNRGYHKAWASQTAWWYRTHLPTQEMQETRVRSLG